MVPPHQVPPRIPPHIRPWWLKQRQFLRRLQTIQKVPRRKNPLQAPWIPWLIQETTKKATIIRVEDKTEAATKAPETEASTTAAPTTKEETVRETTAPSTEGTEETSVKIIRVGSNEEADHEYSGYAVRAAAEEQNAETFLLEPETASGSEAVSETGGLEQAAEVRERCQRI